MRTDFRYVEKKMDDLRRDLGGGAERGENKCTNSVQGRTRATVFTGTEKVL